MAYIFDGKKAAFEKEIELQRRVERLRAKGVIPKLVAFLVGNNPASEIYINMKSKTAERLEVILQLNKVVEIEADSLIQQIEVYNNDSLVRGIMIQLPLPERLIKSQSSILNTIAKEKDVDGLRDEPGFLPATVKAILYAIEVSQKQNFLSQEWNQVQAVVVGASGMVGKPLSDELESLGINVTRYDEKTLALKGQTLRSCTLNADLLISTTGVPDLITKDMVKPDVVVIDVGAPKGDVAENVRDVASFITPVPGGIGPMTVVCLMENVIEAVERLTIVSPEV